jgi:hypothetical protein
MVFVDGIAVSIAFRLVARSRIPLLLSHCFSLAPLHVYQILFFFVGVFCVYSFVCFYFAC